MNNEQRMPYTPTAVTVTDCASQPLLPDCCTQTVYLPAVSNVYGPAVPAQRTASRLKMKTPRPHKQGYMMRHYPKLAAQKVDAFNGLASQHSACDMRHASETPPTSRGRVAASLYGEVALDVCAVARQGEAQQGALRQRLGVCRRQLKLRHLDADHRRRRVNLANDLGCNCKESARRMVRY
jgi:hypothetical protein